MTKDLPDFQSEIVSAAVEATAFRFGLDAAKPASPAKGDIWLAIDTTILYVCYTAGAWTNLGALYLLLAGGTMSGAIAMGTNKITGLGDPTAAQDAATKAYVDVIDAKLDDVTVSEPARAINGTVYQNTSGKIVIAVIQVLCRVTTDAVTLSGTSLVTFVCDSNAAPTTVRGIVSTRVINTASVDIGNQLAFILVIPPSWYYKATASTTAAGVTPTIGDWHEYNLL